MKILIVDDTPEKVEYIKEWVLECSPECEIDIADCAHVGIKNTGLKHYDLIVLDVLLPFSSNGTPTEEAATWFVDELASVQRPADLPLVIGATQFPDAKRNVEDAFGKYMWKVLVVEAKGGMWREDLKRVIAFAGSKSVRIQLSSPGRRFDAAVLTALRHPEFHAVVTALGGGERIVVGGTNENWVGCIINDGDGQPRSVLVACAEEMGMSSMSALTTRVVLACRPKVLILSGIMGGNKSHVSLGDVIAIDETWDCRAGKLSEQGFKPDVRCLPGSSALRHAAIGALPRNEMIAIAASWTEGDVSHLPSFKHGAAACSPAVLAYDKAFDDLTSQKRKVLGVEMEAFGCYCAAAQLGDLAPKVIALKSVCDLGDNLKSDGLQRWCAYLSAEASKRLLQQSVIWGDS